MNRLLKYKIIGIFFLIICIMPLSSCDLSKSDKLKEIKDMGYNHYEEVKKILTQAKDGDESIEKLNTYLITEKYETLRKKNNLMINFQEGADKKNTTLLMVVLNNDNDKDSAKSLATLLTLIENNKKSKFRGLITIKDKNSIANLTDDELESKEIILIEANDRERLLNGSVYVDEISMSKNVSFLKPAGDLAYKIEIKGFDKVNNGDRARKHTNPIEFISDILLRSQNADLNVEVASFNSGGNIYEFPNSASATVVIESSSEEKFESRLESAKEDFEEKMRKDDLKATFSYEKIDVPNKVLGYDDSRQLLSAIYTIEDGVYKTEKEDFEGEVLGIFSLSKISTGEDKLQITVLARAVDEQTRAEMLENYATTASVLEYNIALNKLYDGWKVTIDDTKYWLQSGLSKELGFKGTKSIVDFEENELSRLSDKLNNKKIINIEFDFNNFEDFIYNLNSYLTKK